MSILEELWYGNIEPAEYDISPNKKYKEMLQLISRNEDKLLATMTDAQKELFTKYADCVREYQVMAEYLLFQNSFRLGARIMLEKVMAWQKILCKRKTTKSRKALRKQSGIWRTSLDNPLTRERTAVCAPQA